LQDALGLNAFEMFDYLFGGGFSFQAQFFHGDLQNVCGVGEIDIEAVSESLHNDPGGIC